MNRIFFFFFLFLSAHSFAQKTVIILDKISRKPIENVNVYSVKNGEGTFTNTDGKVKLSISDNQFRLSHLSYNDTTVTVKPSNVLDSLFLSPRGIELKQVQIISFDLRKSLNYVLDHYNDLYVNIPTSKECTFKEVFLMDNQYKRLILSQIEWWSKSSLHPLNGNYSKFTRLRLGNIDFYRNDPMGIAQDNQKKDTTKTRSTSLDPKEIVNNIYLNYVIGMLLSYPENINSTVEEAPSGQLIISFETEPKQVKNFSSVATGRITFDKATKAVIQYSCEVIFKNNIETKKGNGGSTYTYEQRKSIANYSFDKSINNLWSLKHCDFHADGIFDYHNTKHDFTFENSFYVLRETEAKKIEEMGTIDLDKGIYTNFPSKTIVNSNPILLSSIEENFINKK